MPDSVKTSTSRLLLFIALAGGWFSLAAQNDYLHTDKIEVVDFEGLQTWLEAYDEDLLVVNFWATWCKPCVDELYLFEELQASVEEERVKVLLVSLDFVRGHEEKLPAFLDRHDMTLDVALLDDPDANTWIDKVSPGWSGAIPGTWLRSKEGTSFHEGAFATLAELQLFVHNHPF